MAIRQTDSDDQINEIADDLQDLKRTLKNSRLIHRPTSILTRSTASRTR